MRDEIKTHWARLGNALFKSVLLFTITAASFRSIDWMVAYLVERSTNILPMPALLWLSEHSRIEQVRSVATAELADVVIYVSTIVALIYSIRRLFPAAPPTMELIRSRWMDVRGKLWKTTERVVVAVFIVLAIRVGMVAFGFIPQTPSGVQEAHLSGIDFFAAATSTIAIAPACEEIICRGLLFNICRLALIDCGHPWFGSRMSALIALIASSSFFGIMHGTFHAFLTTFPDGVIQCCVYIFCGNIYAPILVHAALNGISVLASLMN
jgi:membrane protease YdiL (CAAX protease family)